MFWKMYPNSLAITHIYTFVKKIGEMDADCYLFYDMKHNQKHVKIIYIIEILIANSKINVTKFSSLKK